MSSYAGRRLAHLLLLAACNGSGSADGAQAPATAAGDPVVSARKSDKCDAAEFSALLGALSAAAPSDKPELVATRLGDACALPPVFERFFALNLERRSGGESSGRFAMAAAKGTHAALTEICPDAVAIKKQLLNEPGALRSGILYERCDFQRFGLIEKEAWLRGTLYSPLPFFAYDWLVRQGLAEEHAKTIATVMIWDDRKSWGLKDQELPRAPYLLAKIPDALPLHLTQNAVLRGGARLTTISDGAIEPAALQGHLIGPVFDDLAEEAEKAKHLKPDEPAPPTLVVIADADFQQGALIDVLRTAARAGYGRVAFVGQSAPFEYGAVLAEFPTFNAGSGPDAAAELVVRITHEGVRVAASTPGAARVLIPRGADTQHDFAALTAAAQAHRKTHPSATIARVSADDATEFSTLV